MGAHQSARAAERAFASGEEVNFDHFQILRAIGKGSFGKVCIVRKKDSQKMYAMKYMNKYQCAQRGALRNVLREVDILTTLEHPFLVNLWFSFQDEEDLFMVSDLLLGGDLRYHVKQQVVFSEDCVKLYVCELGLALDYLRSKKIVHRDIKPDNILLDEEGHAHITDFNIATVLENDQLATSMSGTKPYMAPEIFDCAMDECVGYGYPVDWWSLGVCAYEMLCGERPYDIHSSTSLVDVRMLFTCPISYSSFWSPGIVELLTRLLCVRPGPRISTLEELKRVSCLVGMNLEAVLRKQVKPSFTPPNDHLNCDPTFELEEMIIEAKPLHKKKKRLAKQRSLREMQNSLSIDLEGDIPADMEHLSEFRVYNREQELVRLERERKEQAWEEELLQAMNASDPCGLPGFTCGTPEDTHHSEHTYKVLGGSGNMVDSCSTGSASKTNRDNDLRCLTSKEPQNHSGSQIKPLITEKTPHCSCQSAEEAACQLSSLHLGNGGQQTHQENSAMKKAEFLLKYTDYENTPGNNFS